MKIDEEIKTEVLLSLYLYEFTEEGERNLHKLREHHSWEEETFEKAIQRMVYDNLIKPWTMGGNYRIQVLGILEFERQVQDETPIVDTNLQIRESALYRLAEAYEENVRSLGVHYSQIFPEGEWPDKLIVKNLQTLVDLFYIETRATGMFNITFSGLDLVENMNRLSSIKDDFKRVKQLDPHPRGFEFQKLFSRVLRERGWQTDESVKTAHEEIDVIFAKRREYYLVECKWEKDPIQASVVREVFGKISNRVGVNALIVSMSGFTSGSVEQAKDYATQRAILLFGPSDIQEIINDPA